MVERMLINSRMTAANVQNAWKPVTTVSLADAIQETAGIIGKEQQEQEKIAFERLNLEAVKLQRQQLDNIQYAETSDVIPEIEQDFQNTLKAQFSEDKWGKRWLEKKGESFFANNSLDVAKARAAKEQELTILETNKTLKSFADAAALGAADRAAYYQAKAGNFIDTREFLTPEQKEQARQNFNKLMLGGMVAYNTDTAISVLSGGSIPGLSEIDRAEYMNKAKQIQQAKLKEIEEAEKVARDKQKLSNAMHIAELNVGLITGKAGIKEIEEAKNNKIFDLEPAAYTKAYQFLNKGDNSELSDPATLKDVRMRIKENAITVDEIIDLRMDELLNKADTDEALSRLNAKKPKEDADGGEFDKEVRKLKADYNTGMTRDDLEQRFLEDKISLKAYEKGLSWFEAADKTVAEGNKAVAESAEDASGRKLTEDIINYKIHDTNEINQKYAEGEISKDVRDDGLKQLKNREEKDAAMLKSLAEKSEDAALKAGMKMIDSRKITEEMQINRLFYDGGEIISAANREKLAGYLKEKKTSGEKEKAAIEKNAEKLEFLKDMDAVDNGTIDERGIYERFGQNAYDETHAEKLVERLNKKLAREGKLPDGKKMQMVLDLYSDLENLYNNPDAKVEDFEKFNNKVIEYMNNDILLKQDGEKILNTFSLSYMAKMETMVGQYGKSNWFRPDVGFPALNSWMNDILGKAPKKSNYNKTAEQRAQYDVLMGARARNAITIYQLYADALDVVAKESGMSGAADIIGIENDITRSQIYTAAVELTKKTWAKSQYKSLQNTDINPTAILSRRDGLVNISNEADGSRAGSKLNEKRISKLLYDKDAGRYALKYEDGEIKEITREVYKSLGGKN